MSQPIYRFYRGTFTNAWHQLSQEERDNIAKEMGKAFEEQGIKNLGQYRTFWSSEYSYFGLEEFPNVEAVQKWRETMDRWSEYFELESMLGIK